MTTLERTEARPAGARGEQAERSSGINVGSAERRVSVAAGATLAALGIGRRGISGLIMAGIGGMLAYRGASGHCPAYATLGVSTSRAPGADEIARRGIHVEQALLINRSPDDLYRHWRNFENLPGIMSHLQSVRIIDEKRSHWVASAPSIAGGSVEWDAEITADQPGALIAWRSLEGSEVDTAGQIRFGPALGDRGTEVHVSMDYIPPAGRVGHWLATLVGEGPWRQIHDDLRNFKRLMETGEIPTIIGQPHGTCTGVGERYEE